MKSTNPPPFALFGGRLLIACGFIAWALHLFRQTPTLLFPDSSRYLLTLDVPILSFDFWFGGNPPTILLFYRLTGGDLYLTPRLQLGFALLAWLSLALLISRLLQPNALKLIGMGGLLLFGLSVDVFLWSRMILSESVSVSFFVLMLAVWLRLLDFMQRRPHAPMRAQAPAIGLTLLLTLLWMGTRLPNAYTLLGFALLAGLGFFLMRVRWRAWRLSMAVLVVGLLIGFGAGNYHINRTATWTGPLVQYILENIYPDDQKTAFWAERGLPTDPAARATTLPVTDNWRAIFDDWLHESGRQTLIAYWLADPPARLSEPLRHWDMIAGLHTPLFAFGDTRYGIMGEWQRRAHGLSFDSSSLWLAVVGLAALFICISQILSRKFDLRYAPPLVLIAAAYPNMFLIWYGNAYESRQFLGAYLLAVLGVLTLALFMAEAALKSRQFIPRLLLAVIVLISLLDIFLGVAALRDQIAYPLLSRLSPSSNLLKWWGVGEADYKLYQSAQRDQNVLDYRGGRFAPIQFGTYGAFARQEPFNPAAAFESYALRWADFRYAGRDGHPYNPQLIRPQDDPDHLQINLDQTYVAAQRQFFEAYLPADLRALGYAYLLIDSADPLPPLFQTALTTPELYQPIAENELGTLYQLGVGANWAHFAFEGGLNPDKAALYAAHEPRFDLAEGALLNPMAGGDEAERRAELGGLINLSDPNPGLFDLFWLLDIMRYESEADLNPDQSAALARWRETKSAADLRNTGFEWLLVDAAWLGFLSEAETATLSAEYDLVMEWEGHAPRRYHLYKLR